MTVVVFLQVACRRTQADAFIFVSKGAVVITPAPGSHARPSLPEGSIAVVIPTYCDERHIERAVFAAGRIGDEVIVVDGGSTDRTVELAKAGGATVIEQAKGRGRQLHTGALAARSDVLLFLHAETVLPVRARGAILRAMTDPAIVGGNFRLAFTSDSLCANVFAIVYNMRSRWQSIYFGDSGIFVRRDVYQRAGGFRSLPVLEDYDFVRRLEATGRTAFIEDVVASRSARRFESTPLRSLVAYGVAQGLYTAGVSAERLAKICVERS